MLIFIPYNIKLLNNFLRKLINPTYRIPNFSNSRPNLKKQSQFNQQDSTVEQEGEVSIKTKPKKSKTDTNDIGEYIDFEEVDD